jgi:limonene-1,2-epoxide hydrolase
MDTDPAAVVARLHQAMNTHDLDAFVACFDPVYRSEQPAHPNRHFRGSEQVRINWSQFFAGVPDFHADLLRLVAEGDTVWSEWAWGGHRRDGSIVDIRGVTLMGIEHNRIVWGRLYMEETEQDSAGIDATMSRITRIPRPS